MSDETRRRMLGDDAACTVCGCREIAALQRDGDGVIICYECACARDGRSTTELHHPIGLAHNQTIEIPGNLHRRISAAESERPATARENPRDDPLKAIASVFYAVRDFSQLAPTEPGTPFRAVMDWFALHADRLARWLLRLQAKLAQEFGDTWWRALGLPDLFAADGHGGVVDATE